MTQGPDLADRPVLGFDTSGPWCLAGLWGAGPSVDDSIEAMERGQAERLMPLLEELLARAGLGWRDLGAIGVGVGPGNFTGVRIGVSAARGLALALDIPAVGVSGFEALLEGLGLAGRLLVSLPGPQGQAYVQAFLDSNPLGPPSLLTPGDEAPFLREPGARVIGWEAEAVARGLGFRYDADPRTARETIGRGAALALVAARKLREGGALDRPAPLYVRPPDAAPSRDRPPTILPG